MNRLLSRWLEFSVRTEDVIESLAFYKALGFVELETGETWSHRYAVVSDGDISIGLHEREFDAPALTFVQMDLAKQARQLTDGGFDFSFMRLDEDVFNELGFRDRDKHQVTVVEARTFSLAPEAPEDSLCGRFFELTLPVRDVMRAAHFWAPFAPTILSMREEPTPHMRFEAGELPLALSESIALEGPSLCFKCPDRDAVNSAIARHGLECEKFPGFEGAFAVLTSPEGTRLYLFDADFLGEGIEVAESEADAGD